MRATARISTLHRLCSTCILSRRPRGASTISTSSYVQSIALTPSTILSFDKDARQIKPEVNNNDVNSIIIITNPHILPQPSKTIKVEITNILSYLVNLGNTENIHVRQLWLDKIPAEIFVDNLKTKYKYEKEDFVIEPVIGEYDAPMEQRQSVLTMPYSKLGNLIIYGSVGSGKENLISTIIYSLITTYTPEEVNIYIIDFGSEALRMYTKAPHVGGYVANSEKDRLSTLFRMLERKMAERKKLFSNYNGSYSTYVRTSGESVPSIITFVNGFESFNELYPEFAEDFITLTREGSKYGLHFTTTVSATNNIRMKVSQNFNEKLALQMNDDFDYRQIVGRSDVTPNKISGRGLVKREGIFEFQSAYPCPVDNINEHVTEVIDGLLKETSTRAERIPTLPEKVTYSFVSPELGGLTKIPIGVGKEDLNILSVDLKGQLSLLVSGAKIGNLKKFVTTLTYEVAQVENTAVYVVDAEKLDEVARELGIQVAENEEAQNFDYSKFNYNLNFIILL